jgi:ribosomal protein L21
MRRIAALGAGGAARPGAPAVLARAALRRGPPAWGALGAQAVQQPWGALGAQAVQRPWGALGAQAMQQRGLAMTIEAHHEKKRVGEALAQGVPLAQVPVEPRVSKTTLVEHVLPKGVELGKSSKGGQEFRPKDPTRVPVPEPRFAVVCVAGTQFKVVPGDRIIVNKVDAAVGTEYVFEKVLMVGSKERTFIGRPTIDSAKVTAFVEEQTKDAKLMVLKRRTKKSSSRTNKGFRREVTFLHIQKIAFDEANYDK